MVNMIKNKFFSMEKSIKNILKYGIFFSCCVCIIAMYILLTYRTNHVPYLFYIGLSTFRLGLFFVVEFIICALAIDTIKKQVS